jgi:hypothetical protein
VPLQYQRSPGRRRPLRQGEFLAGLWEHRAIIATESATVGFSSILHHLSVVLTADCDLEQDYNMRFSKGGDRQWSSVEADDHPQCTPCVIVCDLYPMNRVRYQEGMNPRIFSAVEKNQNERYHTLLTPLARESAAGKPEYSIIDFKKSFSLPTSSVYKGLLNGAVRRTGVIPAVYLQDLMHRFYGFLSRVGPPD